jgi:hypothetical protein
LALVEYVIRVLVSNLMPLILQFLVVCLPCKTSYPSVFTELSFLMWSSNFVCVHADPANASVITQCGGIPLVVQCLSSPVRNTVSIF